MKRRPDLAFVSAAKWPVDRRSPRTPSWALVLDLAVEVISASYSANEVMEMVRDFFQCGVRAVWVVYPLYGTVHVYESPVTIRVFRAGVGDVLDGGDVVPAFTVPLTEVFGPPEERP